MGIIESYLHHMGMVLLIVGESLTLIFKLFDLKDDNCEVLTLGGE